MRAAHDAVMIGRGTAEADDPMLDVRDLGDVRQPVRVVFDSKMTLDVGCRLLQTADKQPTWIVHKPGAKPPSGYGDCKCFEAQNIAEAMQALAQAGLTRVLCEGGGTLAASLLKHDLVDDLVIFSAGKFIGADGLSGVGAVGTEVLDQAPKFELRRTQEIGNDVMHVWRRR